MTAPVSITVELYIDGAWVDITTYVRTHAGVVIRHGAGSEAGTADPAECRLTVNNTDGRFTPGNPTGPYYGFIGRNTPLRVSVGGSVRFHGEVSEFPTRWDPSGAVVEVPLIASGPLRRLVRGRSTDSVFRDALVNLQATDDDMAAYWSMEDGAGAQEFASAIEGAPPLVPLNAGSVPTAQGYTPSTVGYASAAIPTFDTTAVTGNVPAYTFTGSATYGLLVHVPDAGTTNSPFILQVDGGGTAFRWTLQRIADSVSGIVRVGAFANVGSPPVYTQVLNAAGPVMPAGSTYYMYLELTNNGANVDWFLTILGLGNASGTLVGYNVGQATKVVVGGYTSSPLSFDAEDDWGLGHVVIGKTNTTLDGSAAVEDPLLGYTLNPAFVNADGESITDRMTRLAAYGGVAITNVDGSIADVEDLGADIPGGVLDRMREAEKADAGGILTDDVTTLGLRYTTRTSLYSDQRAASTVDLNYTSGNLSDPLEPVDDDAVLTNDVTVKAERGAIANVQQTTGRLNVEPFPTGVGRYPTSETLALAYTVDPVHHAGWLLNVGTDEGTRYPAVTVDLVANPGLVASMNALRPGHWIKLSNLPAWLEPGLNELIVRGWEETLDNYHRTITLVCTPADPYKVFTIANQTFGRLDSDTTTTNEPLDTTETGVDYTGDTWITTAGRAGDFPFPIVIGGEVMNVTAATAGSFTVTRSVNGVVKSHLTGQPIRLAYPVHLAL